MKEKITSRLVSLLLAMCMVLALLPTVALADGPLTTGETIEDKITACTGVKDTDDNWVKYIKAEFDKRVDTASNAIDDSWFDTSTLVADGTCDVWDGTIFSLDASTLPTTIDETKEYKVDGEVVLTAKCTGKTADASPKYLYEYHVWSAEALNCVMKRVSDENSVIYDDKIVLEKDMDLNGKYYKWPAYGMNQGQTFDGNSKTIYNTLSITIDKRAGFITSCDRGAEISNVTFQTAYVIGTYHVGMIGYAGRSGDSNKLTNLHARNIVSIAAGNGDGDSQNGALFGRVEKASAIRNCSAEDSVAFGKNHVGSLSASVVGVNANSITAVTNCYSVGCSVFSTGTHSGGFVSCGGNVDCADCFTDVDLYGSDKIGAFIGAANGTSSFTNCYASGFIEGTLNIGGFIGAIEKYGSGSTSTNDTFVNCYTTALVGLRSGGASEGGFVGLIDKDTTSKFENCYAAGEVGSTDTEITANTAQPDAVGGFVGSLSATNASFTDCYYDKQTTAMRECGVGSGTVRSGGIITGVLTTDTEKAGTGLMSAPTGAGFTGFSNDNTDWDFTAVDHYPELAVFSEAAAADWGGDARTAALVRAYSKSSTAGVQLETWDKVVDTTTGKLTVPSSMTTTYDTTRDIVSGFPLTSKSITQWDRIGTADSTGATGMTSTLAGTNYPVLDLKHQNGKYLCDELTCGIEWLKVSVDQEYLDSDGSEQTVTATRRMRVIPTSSIDAGDSAVITGNLYDHADDVALLFSTATRMATGTPVLGDSYDVTTGIFPDRSDVMQTPPLHASNPLTEQQKTLMQHDRNLADEAAINGAFSTGNDEFSGVSASFMQKDPGVDDNTSGSMLYTYLYKVNSIDSDGKINTDANPIDLDAVNPNSATIANPTYAQELNGYTPFPNTDMQYLLTYVWELRDGRSLMDAKLVRTAQIPFHLNLNVYQDSIGNSNLYTGGVSTYADEGTAPTASDLTDEAAAANAITAYENAAAAWKPSNPADTLKSINLTLDYSGREYTATVNHPNVGDPITVDFVVYRIVYRDAGYYTIEEHVKRTYELKETTDHICYLMFDKDRGTELATYHADGSETGRTTTLDDVENDIRVDVVYTPAPVVVDPDQPDPPERRPHVTVTKASVHTIDASINQITYTLTAKNSGDAAATGVYIRDFVPAYTHFASVDASGSYGMQDGREYVSYFIQRLAAGETAVMTFTVTLYECMPAGTVIRNTGCYTTTESTTPPPSTIEPEKTTNTVEDTPTIEPKKPKNNEENTPDSILTGTNAAELTKVDANDRTTMLSGARFRLYHVVGDTVQLIGARTTDKDGKIRMDSLPAGSYYWEEIGPPAGYQLDASRHAFSVSENELSELTVTNTRADVPEWLNGIDHFAYIIGYLDGDVRPMNPITRAEVATIFFRLLTDDVRDRYMTQKNSFSDVNEGMWFNCAISTMSAMGIVNGYPDGTFDPNGSISRVEFAAMAARFDANGNSTPASFYDIYEHWGRKEISIAANNGWVLGYEDGTFRPDQLIRRSEAMAMVDRILQRVPEASSDLLDDMVKWPDNADPDTWFYFYVQEATNSHFFDRKRNGCETWTQLRPVRDWEEFEK